jgi:hypothetical protein
VNVGATTEEVRILDVTVDHADLAHFLGNAEIGAGVFFSETGGRFSMIGVATKCCDACLGRVVGCSSVCSTIATGHCNAISSRLVWLVPGWLQVMRLLL